MNKRKITAIIMGCFLVSNLSSGLVYAYDKAGKGIENNINVYSNNAIFETEVPKSEMTATVTSSQNGEGADKAIDGNINTIWHTPWTGVDLTNNPQSLTLNLGKERKVSSIVVTPRQSGGNNGIIKNYKIYSGDTVIAEGVWNGDSKPKYIEFDKPVVTNNIKVEAISSIGDVNNKFVSIAEVDIYEVTEEPTKLIDESNKTITSGNGGKYSGDIDEIKSLNEGTAIIRFKNNGNGIQSLFSISNNTKANEHFHVYLNGGTIGYELRKQSGDLSKGSANATLNDGINTIAFRASKGGKFSLYLNGEKILDKENSTNFLADLDGVTSVNIGSTDRNSGSNRYNFTGDVDFFKLYDKALGERYLSEVTNETASTDLPLPEGALKTDPIGLFAPGELGSNNFRIPALYTTKDGTVLASIDVRKGGGHDAPNNIDTGIKRSTDGGETWDKGKIILDYPGQSSAIDTSMVQDEGTGRIFLLVTHFAENYGFPNCQKGSGYVEVEGNRYLKLIGANNAVYTVRENGIVYDNSGKATKYKVDSNQDLYEGETKVGNVLLKNSPLKVMGTSFLSLIYSDDDGETWSDPIDLNKQVKEDWMKFLGTGPGRGHQIKNGDHAGRLVFPVYLTNEAGFQSSAVIYSDDKGATWEIGETATDGRAKNNGEKASAETITGNTSGGLEQLTESQVVEMPDGQLKLFMRNTGSKVMVATSFDGGETWEDDVVKEEKLQEPYCQLSVMNYSQKVDGKDALIFSNPNAGNRSNGTVRIGLISENGKYDNGKAKYNVEWKYNQVVAKGTFAYSCLTETQNGDIGLFYEGTDSQEMSFTKMNTNFIKADLLSEAPEAKIISFKVDKEERGYLPGEKISLTIGFDQAVSLIGNRSITLNIAGKGVALEMTENKEAKEYNFEGVLPENIEEGKYTVSINGKDDVRIINVIGKLTNISEDIDTNLEINIVNSIENSIDKGQLQKVVDEANSLNEYDYTDDSLKEYKRVLEEAKALLVNEGATQEEVNNMVTSLRNAIDALVSYNEELRNLVSQGNSISEEELDKLIPIVVEEFKTALEEAAAILEDEEATHEEIDEAYEKLSSAIDNLNVYKGNKTNIAKIVDKINGLNEEDYTSDSWSILNGALVNAKKVLDDANATVDDVANIEKELNSALDGLIKNTPNNGVEDEDKPGQEDEDKPGEEDEDKPSQEDEDKPSQEDEDKPSQDEEDNKESESIKTSDSLLGGLTTFGTIISMIGMVISRKKK